MIRLVFWEMVWLVFVNKLFNVVLRFVFFWFGLNKMFRVMDLNLLLFNVLSLVRFLLVKMGVFNLIKW